MVRTDLELWLFRGLWLILPFTVGSIIGDALVDSSDVARNIIIAAAWIIWAVNMVAIMVPRTQTLTLIRIVVPMVIPAAIWAALESPDIELATIVALVAAVAVTVFALRSTVGDLLVDGSSYGDESRFLLSTPGPILLGPVFILWALMAAGLLIGPVALAHGRWPIGVIAAVIGIGTAIVAVPIFDRLSNRWIVFVPAGVVLHDKTVLREPQLFDHLTISEFGPAPVSGPDHDLTLGALGLALRVRLTEPSSIVENARTDTLELTQITGFIFSPNRPGAVVAEAKRRHIRLG